MSQLLTMDAFEQAVAARHIIVIIDTTGSQRVHMSSCVHISSDNFETKVVKGASRNGKYFAFESVAKAQAAGYQTLCKVCCR